MSTPVPTPTAGPAAEAATVLVRFYAGAAEAAGAQELRLSLVQDPQSLAQFLESLPARAREASGAETAQQDDAGPDLARVCSRSSFLINGTQAKPDSALLRAGDQLDVLPPFAGG
ncbi:MoaD/ThiS family protein [Nesterenkonia flava]|uniref:MoaD/ThiS family protein n=1 Tax=Nesterenkonia flava TaxID=469799 RepID=A0ABU1FSH4_9MICC|nr:MoaD/ThiS family protein [Nesterenkonia flava]MDR5711599.1 MoaD/ThiS family protein [Nesterenkonia flava]